MLDLAQVAKIWLKLGQDLVQVWIWLMPKSIQHTTPHHFTITITNLQCMCIFDCRKREPNCAKLNIIDIVFVRTFSYCCCWNVQGKCCVGCFRYHWRIQEFYVYKVEQGTQARASPVLSFEAKRDQKPKGKVFRQFPPFSVREKRGPCFEVGGKSQKP